MRVFSYNWRLAWVVVPAFIWGWLGLTVVTGAMLQPDGPNGPPPLGLKLERGLHGLHIPGILRAVHEDESGALVLVMELPPGARDQLDQREAEGARGKTPGTEGQAPEFIPGLDQLLGGAPQQEGTGQRGPDGELRPVIPNLPDLPAGVSIKIVEPGEIAPGRPELELLEGSRVIDLPRGDKLIVGQRWAVRVGHDGARLLKKPQGSTEKLRKWMKQLRRDDDGGGPRSPGAMRERRDQRRDRRDERRGRGERPGMGPGQGGAQRPPQGDGPPGDGQGPPPGDRPPKDGQISPPPGEGRPPGQGQPPQDGAGPPRDQHPPSGQPPSGKAPSGKPPSGKPPGGKPPGGGSSGGGHNPPPAQPGH